MRTAYVSGKKFLFDDKLRLVRRVKDFSDKVEKYSVTYITNTPVINLVGRIRNRLQGNNLNEYDSTILLEAQTFYKITYGKEEISAELRSVLHPNSGPLISTFHIENNERITFYETNGFGIDTGKEMEKYPNLLEAFARKFRRVIKEDSELQKRISSHFKPLEPYLK